jgi:Flp pilus assembly protein protease CpaA
MIAIPIIIITVLLIIAGYSDLRYRKLPGKQGNIVPLLIIIAGTVGMIWSWNGIDFLMLIINVIFAITILYSYKSMGMAGGDIKILLALTIAFPFTMLAIYVFIISMVPGAILLILKIRPVPFITCLTIGYLVILFSAL